MNRNSLTRSRMPLRFAAAFFAVILLVCCLFPGAAALSDPAPQAEAVYLADPESGFVLYEKNADEKRFPASTTKIMTALLTLENVDDLNTLVEVTEEDFNGVESDSSKAGFKVGEQVPVIDLLYGLMLPSGNEAANTLARYVGGSVDKFVEMMNDRAKELGCENTHFMNPNGLHNEDHYTTARDLYTITQRAMQDETFQLIVNTAQKTLSKNNMTSERGGKPLKVYTTNMLIFSRHQTAYYYAYAKGIKTGHTSQAGYCLVAAAEKKGGKLISVMLGCERPEGAAQPVTFAETRRMFEWGYENFTNMKLVEKGAEEYSKQISVRLSTEDDKLVLVTQSDLEGTVPKDINLEDLELNYDIPESVDAPVKAGDKLGTLNVQYNGVDYGTVDMVALSDVSRSEVLYYADKIEHFFQSPLFRILVVLIIVLFFAYFGILFYRARRKRLRRQQMMKSRQARYRDYDKRDRDQNGR